MITINELINQTTQEPLSRHKLRDALEIRLNSVACKENLHKIADALLTTISNDYAIYAKFLDKLNKEITKCL
jgi:hypothetical protein